MNMLQLSAHLHRLHLGCNASKRHSFCPAGNHIHTYMQIGAHMYKYDCKRNILHLHMLCFTDCTGTKVQIRFPFEMCPS